MESIAESLFRTLNEALDVMRMQMNYAIGKYSKYKDSQRGWPWPEYPQRNGLPELINQQETNISIVQALLMELSNVLNYGTIDKADAEGNERSGDGYQR